MAAELAGQQILLTERVCRYRALFERTLTQEGAHVDRQLEFASVEALKQCSIARMGVAVLPEFVVEAELQCGIGDATLATKTNLCAPAAGSAHRYMVLPGDEGFLDDGSSTPP